MKLRSESLVSIDRTSALDASVHREVLLLFQAGVSLIFKPASPDLALVRQFTHAVSVTHWGMG